MSEARSRPALQFALAVLLSGASLRPVGFQTPAGRADGPATDSVSGWVVGANEWLDRGFLGISDKGPARTSADLGSLLVILTDAGSLVYALTMTADGFMRDTVKLAPFAGQRVTAAGTVVTRTPERGILIDRVTSAPAARAPHPAAREVAEASVAGRVAALSCWLGSGESGSAHVRCAKAHAWTCDPLVLVDDSGHVYYPVVRNRTKDRPGFISLIKYCEQKVVASGTIITRGKARAVVIDAVAEYEPDRSLEVSRPEAEK